MSNVAKLPLSKLVLFAMGQFGWSLSSFGVFNLMNYFYMPPESGKVALFPTYIYAGRIFGILTALGVITAVARAFDAVTNPSSRPPLYWRCTSFHSCAGFRVQ